MRNHPCLAKIPYRFVKTIPVCRSEVHIHKILDAVVHVSHLEHVKTLPFPKIKMSYDNTNIVGNVVGDKIVKEGNNPMSIKRQNFN